MSRDIPGASVPASTLDVLNPVEAARDMCGRYLLSTVSRPVGGRIGDPCALRHIPDPGRGAVLVLTFLASLTVAIASWYVIDRQVMARRNDWYTPARGRAAMIVAYSLLVIGLVGGGTIRMMGG